MGHSDSALGAFVLPVGEASHDAGTASVAVVVPTGATRRTMWVCSCHACDRTKSNEARGASKIRKSE